MMWIMPDDDLPPLLSTELLEQLGDAVTVVGFDWRYRYVSERAAAIIGRPADELVGAYVWGVFPEVVGTPEHVAATRAMSERVSVKIVWFFDRVGRWFEQHAIPTSAGLVIVVDDVTEREEDTRRGEQLLSIGNALAQAMSVADVAAVTQGQALPLLGAAGGTLVLVDEPHGVARSTGWVGLSEQFAHRWTEFPLTAQTPFLDAYRSGEPVILDDLGEARERYPELVDDLAPIGQVTVVAFPLVSAATPLGALVGYFTQRSITVRDRSFIATVAAMCAQALTRAKLFDVERRSVEALQRHLVPQRLPEIKDVEIAVRYDSSESAVNIGGDWYDVVPLPGGAVGLVIGDVEGHDVEAAALMGLVRSAVRAYALEGHPPALILDRANQFLAGLHAQRLVTLAYLQLHPVEHLVIVASAGHLPTFVAAPDGSVQEVPAEIGPPLGAVEATLCWPETSSAIPTDAKLAMFTDGLVEQRDADIQDGLERVQKTLVVTWGDVVRDVVTTLVEGRPRNNDDDVAVLVAVVSTPPVDPSRREVTRRLPPTAASVFIARRFVTQVMELWSVPEATVDRVELAVSELATNAARHSDDAIEVSLTNYEQWLRVAVADSSHRMPRQDDTDDALTAGRGLVVIEAISDSWGIDSTGLGKTVWCRFDLGS